MLQLTDTQIRILKLLLKYGNNEEGISTYSIGKYQFSRRTFEINREHLLKNKIIQVVKSVKAGKQQREYYDITPLGFFSLLQNMSRKELKREIKTKRFSDFLPKISTHWNDIVKIHHGQEDMILELLKISISNIDLIIRPHHTEEFFADSYFQLSTTISRNHSLSLTLKQEFINWTESDLKEWEEIRSKPILGINLEKEESIQENIVNQSSFLFYFNLLRILRDDVLLHEICQRTSPKRKYDNLDDERRDYLNNCYNKMIKNNPTQKMVKILKSDDEIMEIIKKNLKKWNKELENNHPFKDIFTLK
ncbi:MAG: hypothetical protein OEW78_05150 [Nitrosopumilus sp.]|uniref:hypothetical protein n=1 Tax=Nitrosopumilus sp. TaxID=2024843 RepID=UPI00247203E6|nr:hypothetical protein [Nitrosopumilus sp.]MDH5431254.1 hypothetical protein [Nitrosopumilus sp.]